MKEGNDTMFKIRPTVCKHCWKIINTKRINICFQRNDL